MASQRPKKRTARHRKSRKKAMWLRGGIFFTFTLTFFVGAMAIHGKRYDDWSYFDVVTGFVRWRNVMAMSIGMGLIGAGLRFWGSVNDFFIALVGFGLVLWTWFYLTA